MCVFAFWNQRCACLALPSEKAKLTKSSQWSSLFLYSLFVIWTNGNRQMIDFTMVDYFWSVEWILTSLRCRGSYDASLIYFMITCVFSLRPVRAWTYIRNKTCYVTTDDHEDMDRRFFWYFLLKSCFQLFSESIINKMLYDTLMYGKQNKVCDPIVQAITWFECHL